MAQLSKEELRKIAQMSALHLSEDEIEQFTQELQAIITYTDQLASVPLEDEMKSDRTINTFRDDVAASSHNPLVVEQSPARAEQYFIVPRIIDANE